MPPRKGALQAAYLSPCCPLERPEVVWGSQQVEQTLE